MATKGTKDSAKKSCYGEPFVAIMAFVPSVSNAYSRTILIDLVGHSLAQIPQPLQ
jgi:hypothetical protein